MSWSDRAGSYGRALWIGCLVVSCLHAGAARAQDRGDYILGADNRLEMVVFIIGEVKEPGEYRVLDTTNVLELVSKAGGPTEYGSLSNVSIRRALRPPGDAGGQPAGRDRIQVNLSDYLAGKTASRPPTLVPGDVVTVSAGGYRTWRRVFTVVRDLSVVASAYFLYLRATD